MFDNTNPYPYIAAAYIVGAVLIFGYALFIYREKKKLNDYINPKEGG